MDTPIQPEPQEGRSIASGVVLATVGLILILVAVALYVFGFPNFGNKGSDQLVLSFDFGSGSALYQFSGDVLSQSQNFVPYTVLVGDETLLRALDSVPTEMGTYYLLVDGDIASNVYLKTEEGITRITNSNSAKRNLSYDVESQTLAYEFSESLSSGTELWEIARYNVAKGTETPTGIYAINSLIANGGNALFVVSSTSLSYVSVDDALEPMTILGGIEPHAIAIDNEGKSITVVNPTSRAINTYSVGATGGVTFTSATAPLTFDPVALSIREGEVYAAYKNGAYGGNVYTIKNLESEEEIIVPAFRPATLTSFSYE